jgi:hypothetical protein
MGTGKCVDDAAPDTSPLPPNKSIVAGGVRTNSSGRSRSGAPERKTQKDAIEDTSVVHPRNATRLVRRHGLDGSPFIIREFVAHDSSPQFGSLNHGGLVRCNASGQAPVGHLQSRSGNQPANNFR